MEEAFAEYGKALEIVAPYHKPWNRDLAIYHSQMAMSALFLENRAPSALQHYKQCANIFNMRIQHVSDSVCVCVCLSHRLE